MAEKVGCWVALAWWWFINNIGQPRLLFGFMAQMIRCRLLVCSLICERSGVQSPLSTNTFYHIFSWLLLNKGLVTHTGQEKLEVLCERYRVESPIWAGIPICSGNWNTTSWLRLDSETSDKPYRVSMSLIITFPDGEMVGCRPFMLATQVHTWEQRMDVWPLWVNVWGQCTTAREMG